MKIKCLVLTLQPQQLFICLYMHLSLYMHLKFALQIICWNKSLTSLIHRTVSRPIQPLSTRLIKPNFSFQGQNGEFLSKCFVNNIRKFMNVHSRINLTTHLKERAGYILSRSNYLLQSSNSSSF